MTLKELYVSAAAKARCTPQRTEESEWKREFEYADMRDLDAAVSVFFDNAARSGKGVWMPKVPELRPLVSNARNIREVRNTGRRVFVAWRCETCNVTCSGFIEPHDHSPRCCQGVPRRPNYAHGEICGGDMAIIHSEAVGAVTA